MSTYYIQAIVLYRRDWREADRLVFLYTREFGKLTAVARGARKINSKLAAYLEPFNEGNFLLAKGKQFDTIVSAEILNYHRGIKENLWKLSMMEFLSGVVVNVNMDLEPGIKLYDLISEILIYLDSPRVSSQDIWKAAWYFIWRYICLLGFRPELKKCLGCKKEIQPGSCLFDLQAGGLVERGCTSHNRQLVELSENSVKLLKVLDLEPLKFLQRVKVPTPDSREISQLVLGYFNYITETSFRYPKL